MKKLFLNFAYIVLSMTMCNTFIACEDKNNQPEVLEAETGTNEGESEQEALQNLYKAVNDYVSYTKEFYDVDYNYRWNMSITVSQQLSKKIPRQNIRFWY